MSWSHSVKVFSCDEERCDASIVANPNIAASGWRYYANSNGVRRDFCPDHAHIADGMVATDLLEEPPRRGRKF